MSTTIRLPDELRTRVAELAKQAGTTSHQFILEATASTCARRCRLANNRFK